jgi:hypothetical protein
VWLRASEAPIREILREWARLGDATIVNGDKITGPPVTLELAGVAERQALEVILREVPGYILAPRSADSVGSSIFDRIVIMPTTTRPLAPAPAQTARRPPDARQTNKDLPEALAALLPDLGSDDADATAPGGVDCMKFLTNQSARPWRPECHDEDPRLLVASGFSDCGFRL